MEVTLIKDWKREGKKTVKKGETLLVLNSVGRNLIKKKIAKPVKDNAITKLFKKKVEADGTKQTAQKIDNKEKKEEN